MVHRPRKRFGQHFLIDEGVVEAIVRAVAPEADQHLVEIGPGLSALTAPLLQAVPHLTAIEIDRDLARRLRRQYSEQQLQLVEADVLQVDFAELAQLVLGASKAQASNDDAAAAVETRGGRRVLRAAGATGARHQGQLRLVGNLPYNISTPLLFHLSEFVGHIRDQHFMLQREVVDRLVASPGSRDYGRLTVMLQWLYHIDKLFDVPPEAFDPPPRVVSSVVRMIPLGASRLQPKNEALFRQLVAHAFSQRRKMLRRSLGDWAQHINWDAIDAPETSRAEALSLAQFVAMADQLHDAGIIA